MRKQKKVFALVLLPVALLTPMIFHSVGYEKTRQNSTKDQLKARALIIATVKYADEHEETYPDATRWEEQLKPFLPKDFVFTLNSNPKHRFAMNSVFSLRKIKTLSSDYDRAVLYFESTSLAPSAHDALTSLPRSGQTVVLAFRLGHVYAHPIEWVKLLEDPVLHKQLVGK